MYVFAFVFVYGHKEILRYVICYRMGEIETSLVRVPELSNQLYECREEYVRYSQYLAAMENLKHIFTVPESVEKTYKWINDGKLLYAHQVCFL